MSDKAAFLAAIKANPQDDTPRLVLADWLDENGMEYVCRGCDGTGGRTDEFGGYREFSGSYPTWETCGRCNGSGRVSPDAARAEFIRLSCELARLGTACIRPSGGGTWYSCCGPNNDHIDRIEDHPDVCEKKPLVLRQRNLFLSHGPQWFAHLPGSYRSTADDMTIYTAEGWKYRVRRGFVEAVEMGVEAFVGFRCPCGGDITYYPDPCPRCKGAEDGIVNGHAAAIFAAEPVTAVRLFRPRELRPWHVSMGGWHWFRDGDPRRAEDLDDRVSSLPTELFDLMWEIFPDSRNVWDGERNMEFGPDDTRDKAAWDALSATCVALGRKRAGVISFSP